MTAAPSNTALGCGTEGHADRPAVAMCVACGAWVCAQCRHLAADGLARCAEHANAASEPTAEPAPAVARPAPNPAPRAPDTAPQTTLSGLEPHPWEMPDRYGPAQAIGHALVQMVKNPITYMMRIPWQRNDLRTPMIFGVTCALIGQVAVVLWALALGDLDAQIAPVFEPLGVEPRTGVLIGLTVVPLLVTVRLLFFAALAHLLLRAFSLGRRPFEATLRIYCYAAVANLFQLIPGPGIFVAMGFAGMLTMTGLRVAHGVTPGQAVLGMLPYLAGLLLGIGL